ncbi:hypothetical protein N7540_005878 [Penicillium herquei]|nr:hypothetical protein N7540_005878 [Penicillium herquei]
MSLKGLFIALLVFIAVSAEDTCSNGRGKEVCVWHGTAPFCGEDGRPLGYTDGTWTLTETTQYRDRGELAGYGQISHECDFIYGSSCAFGSYKRLWCRAG